MSVVIHIYVRPEFYAALVDGRDALALCGQVVEPEMRDGREVEPPNQGNSICMDCLGMLPADAAARFIRRHHPSTQEVAHA